MKKMKSKKSALQIVLDVVLTITFVAFFSKSFTGMNLHELLGIGIGVLFLIHNLLNYNWIIQVSKNLFNKKMTTRTKVIYIIDILLLVAVTIIIITGIKISETIFVGPKTASMGINQGLHKFAAHVALALIGIHIGLHIGFISAFFKRFFCPSKKVGEILAVVTVVICLSLGVLGIVQYNYFNRVNPTSISASKGFHGGPDGQFNIESGENGEGFDDSEITGGGNGNGYGNSNGEGLGNGNRYGATGEGGGPHGGERAPTTSNVLYSFLIMVLFASLTYASEKYLFGWKNKAQRITAQTA